MYSKYQLSSFSRHWGINYIEVGQNKIEEYRILRIYRQVLILVYRELKMSQFHNELRDHKKRAIAVLQKTPHVLPHMEVSV